MEVAAGARDLRVKSIWKGKNKQPRPEYLQEQAQVYRGAYFLIKYYFMKPLLSKYYTQGVASSVKIIGQSQLPLLMSRQAGRN